MVQKVLRFEIKQQRWITVLFQNHCRTHRSFQTVRFLTFHHFAKRSHSAPVALPVVRHRAEEALHLRRSVESLDQFPLGRSEAFFIRDHA